MSQFGNMHEPTSRPEDLSAPTPQFGGGRERTSRPEDHPVPESIRGDDVSSGSNNVGGLARPSRRVIRGKKVSGVVASVQRNYHVTASVQFNNLSEVFQDSLSAEFAQEILEAVFRAWRLPFDQPTALKYAEDLVFGFLIAVTASDKADYNRVFEVPIEPDGRGGPNSVVVNMSMLSDMLIREYGVTRRQFARGMADRVRAYLGDPENLHLQDDVATKVGCDRQMAGLAFDGSTHCKGMNTKEIQFTKTLENRNLFEREDQMASGASDRLLNSITNGARPVR